MPKSRQYKACFIGTAKNRIQELLILKKTLNKIVRSGKRAVIKTLSLMIEMSCKISTEELYSTVYNHKLSDPNPAES